MKIKLKSRWVYRENMIMAACPRSEALFELLQNRHTLRPTDLALLGRMGFEVELVGDTPQLSAEMNKKEIKHHREGATIVTELHEDDGD